MDPTITSAPAATSQPTAVSAPAMPAPAPVSAPAPSAPATATATPSRPSFAESMEQQIAALPAGQPAAPAGLPAALPGAVQAPADALAGGAAQLAAAVPAEDYSWASHLAKHLGIQDQGLLADPKRFVGAVGDEFKNVTNLHRERAELQRELAELKQKVPHYKAWETGQLPPAAAPAPKADEAGWPKMEYDRSWEHIITRDEAGNLVVPQGVDPSIINKLQQFREHRTNVINEQVQDFPGFFDKHAMPLVEQKVAQIFEAKMAQMQEAQQAQQLANQNKEWMIEKNKITGQEVWTEQGAEYMQEARRLADQFPGIPTTMLDELAKKSAIVNIQLRRSQQAAAAAPQAGQPVQQQQPAAVNWQQPAPFAAPQPAQPTNAFNTLGANPAAANGYSTKKNFGDFLKEQLAQQGQVV
jgi:hypothetical protein